MELGEEDCRNARKAKGMKREEKIREIRVVRKAEAEVVMEDDECTKFYFWTDKLIFSTCTIPVSGKSTLDKGHQGAHEVCYNIQGRVVVHFPEKNKYVELNQGDAVLIPEAEPHRVINIGDTMAKLSWSCAPHIGQ